MFKKKKHGLNAVSRRKAEVRFCSLARRKERPPYLAELRRRSARPGAKKIMWSTKAQQGKRQQTQTSPTWDQDALVAQQNNLRYDSPVESHEHGQAQAPTLFFGMFQPDKVTRTGGQKHRPGEKSKEVAIGPLPILNHVPITMGKVVTPSAAFHSWRKLLTFPGCCFSIAAAPLNLPSSTPDWRSLNNL